MKLGVNIICESIPVNILQPRIIKGFGKIMAASTGPVWQSVVLTHGSGNPISDGSSV